MSQSVSYVSYMLRLWKVQADNQTIWVATIQSPGTDEQHSFSNVGALIEFLQDSFGRGKLVSDIDTQGTIGFPPTA